MRVIYIKRKLRTCKIQIQKEKVRSFAQYFFFEIFDFFTKGGPFDVKIKKNPVFSKFFLKKPKNDFHVTIHT